MSMSIVTNINSLIAQENLRVNNEFQGRTIQRLTSGYRINSSADDAAGLAVANKFRSDVSELQQGVRNANDGLSTMQIIDGGLNNISKMLDRLKTLSTQSASLTYLGSRDTLDSEYQSLLTEINRQAANIGLGSGDSQANRFNSDITIYIGGGSAQSNSQVGVDLSGSANIVNATQLGLTGTTVAGVATPIDVGTGDLRSGAYLDQDSSQTYRFATAAGNLDVTVLGTTAGLTGNDIVTQLNAGLAGSGITASLGSSDGKLKLTSTASFAVAVDASVGAGTQIQGAIANAAAVINTSKANFAGGAYTAVTVADQPITFTPTGGSAAVVTLVVADTSDIALTKLRTGLASSGIDVMRLGTNFFFQSNTGFSISRGADGGSNGLAGVAASNSYNATAASTATDVTANAKIALSSITTAVSLLGAVQGKVGSGSNKLQYAIQLAQSQLSSFSAAESRIRDADVAAEAANLTKAQVMQQASLAAMAQANAAPQAVLALLRG